MKKMLSVLSAVTLISTSSSVVVSCNDIANFKYYLNSENGIINALHTVQFTDEDNHLYKMSDYFSSDGYYNYTGVKDSKTNSLAKPKNALTLEQFYKAVETAVSNVAKNSTNENDYNLIISFHGVDIKSENDSNGKTQIKGDNKSADKNWTIKILLSAKASSKIWKGSDTTEINTISNEN